MTEPSKSTNRVRKRRAMLGLTQAELALRAGISRTAVTAIEGDRLAPSVDAALSLADVLGATVEELFGREAAAPAAEIWAWEPAGESRSCWQAEVSGRIVSYPASSAPMSAMLPDRQDADVGSRNSAPANETLVMACCDPAAGMLASCFAATTGMRLIVLARSSRQSLEMLRDGLVHLAGLHYSTPDDPERNDRIVHETLGTGYQLLRMARWQEGITTAPSANFRSVKSVLNAKLGWVGREPGSGARQCLDRLLTDRVAPRRVARDHQGVVEAVRSGWADAGVCVQLASAEAGLRFLAVQEEAFDVCFAKAFAEDRRIKAFLSVVRSPAYRRLLGELPGYDINETGNFWEVKA